MNSKNNIPTFCEYLLLEAISKSLMDKLSKKMKITPDDEPYLMSVEDTKNAYSILNREVFLSKLENVELAVEDFDPKKHRVNETDAFIGQYSISFKRDSLIRFADSGYNDFSLIDAKFKITLINGLVKIDFRDFIIDLTHEMIHEYDYLYGTGKIGMLLNNFSKLRGKKPVYDEHGPFFKSKMEFVRKNFGIDVSTTFKVNNKLNKIDVKESIEKILEGIDESDTLHLNGCEDRRLVEFAKLLRKCIKDTGNNVVEILPNGDVCVSGS